jgi:hypothetical protein
MRLITKRNLSKAIAPYPDVLTVVISWSAVIKASSWKSLNDIREEYSPSVDEVYGYTIFNLRSLVVQKSRQRLAEKEFLIREGWWRGAFNVMLKFLNKKQSHDNPSALSSTANSTESMDHSQR